MRMPWACASAALVAWMLKYCWADVNTPAQAVCSCVPAVVQVGGRAGACAEAGAKTGEGNGQWEVSQLRVSRGCRLSAGAVSSRRTYTRGCDYQQHENSDGIASSGHGARLCLRRMLVVDAGVSCARIVQDSITSWSCKCAQNNT
jgi:hypothetical protein